MENGTNATSHNGTNVKLFTKKEMAAELGVSYRTIERWYSKGYIKRVRIGGRIFFPYNELYRIRDQFIAEELAEAIRPIPNQSLNDIMFDQAQGFQFRR